MTVEEIYFNKEWEEITLESEYKGEIIHVIAYPLDITECDTIVIRAYRDKEHTDENEYGNGLWIDSSMGIIEGNNELYFDTDDEVEESTIMSQLVDEVFTKLNEQHII